MTECLSPININLSTHSIIHIEIPDPKVDISLLVLTAQSLSVNLAAQLEFEDLLWHFYVTINYLTSFKKGFKSL